MKNKIKLKELVWNFKKTNTRFKEKKKKKKKKKGKEMVASAKSLARVAHAPPYYVGEARPSKHRIER
jgi:hypothetical protein